MTDSLKVELYKFANTLKKRLGSSNQNQDEGFLAPAAIKEADEVISALCIDCPGTLAKHLAELEQLWAEARTLPEGPERGELSRQIFTLSHEIKDVSALCQYTLLTHFAESLRDYIIHTELNLQAQVVIIQAHLDAMLLVHKNGYKNDAGPEAEELKKMVRKAIEKYQ